MSASWQTTPGNLTLVPDTIDIWRTSLNLSNKRIDNYLSILSDDEAQRVESYKSAKRRNEFIISRGLLRKAIGQSLDVDPSGFIFEYAEHNKPFLSPATLGVPVTFNVTHSGNQAMIALSLDRTIGIDIEFIRHNVDFKKLAKRFFSKQEARALDDLDEINLPRVFFSCWTRKEAFVKALGDGISFGLSEFSISIDPDDKGIALITHWDKSQALKWTLLNIITDEDYVAAIATENPVNKLRTWNAHSLD